MLWKKAADRSRHALRRQVGRPTRRELRRTPDLLSAGGGIPAAERALLPVLIRGGEHISLILGRLNDDWLTNPSVRNVVAAFRDAASRSEAIDFQSQIAQPYGG